MAKQKRPLINPRTYPLFFAVIAALVFVNLLSKALLSSSGNSLGAFFAKDGDSSGGGGSTSGGGGDDSSSSGGSSNTSGSSSGNSGSGSNDTSGSSNTSGSSTKVEPTESVKIENKVENKTENEQQKLEVKTETNKKEDKTKIDIRSGGVRIKFETENGKLIIKKETDQGEEKVTEQEKQDVENELDNNDLEIASASGNALAVQRNGIKARTTLPISVDPLTNTLFVQTPQGIRTLAILPDTAVKLLLAKGIINSLETNPQNESEQQFQLIEQNGEAVFEAQGFKDEKLLGLFPIKLHKTVTISANNGSLVNQEESLFTRVVDFLSF